MNKLSTVLFAVAFAAGCGGGDDGTPAPAPAPAPPPAAVTYDVAKAWQNLLTGMRSWTVMGIGTDTRSYELTLAFAPGPTGAFPYTGTMGPSADVTATFAINGVGQAPTLSRLYYNATTYGVFGEHAVTDGSCSTAAPGGALPTAAQVGDSGLLYDSNDYQSCVAPSVLDGTGTFTWSLETEAGMTLFCFNNTDRSTTGAVIATGFYCAQVSTDGTLGMKARVTIAEGGVSVVMRN